MQKGGKNISYFPNIITFLRIIISFLLPFVTIRYFFPLYFLAGITDVLDGWLARKLNWTSQLGTFLDSVADLVFFSAVVLRIILTINLPTFIWWGVGLVASIRGLSYFIGYLRFRQFASLHTYLNKITGLLIFLTPLALLLLSIKLWGTLLIFLALLSALEELLIILTTTALDKNCPTFFKQK
ncbi:CDP-alcohol phosphatidyltransferase family protein [Enterococcus devriesei]|uniref:CDP-alcohol phosphatidyltransferase family protein n=1 Tax=Enterococcus devriesei TaxID=319970 RepID=UPI0028AD65F4|nr:CDP-alcohol phosphatidyltransferase family protein [Enterococcus devriesei]